MLSGTLAGPLPTLPAAEKDVYPKGRNLEILVSMKLSPLTSRIIRAKHQKRDKPSVKKTGEGKKPLKKTKRVREQLQR